MESLASRLQTIVLVGTVTLLSLVFVLQFGGPQAEGCTSGGSTYAARVDGETISAGDYNAAYILAGFNRRSSEEQRLQNFSGAVLNGLIERDLLAEEARKLGYHVTEQDVMDRLAEEQTVRLSLGIDAPMAGGEVPVQVQDEEGRFDPDAVRRLIGNYLRRHVGEFAQAQIKEELAERMRQTVRASVQVSDQEIWEGYVRERDSARIKYVQFRSSYYRDQLDPTDADISAWMGSHTDEVDAAYEANQHRYTDLDPQVRARHILFRAAEDDEDARAEAQTAAEAALARVRGGESFEAVATELSQDTVSARRGGDLGYRPRGRNPAAFDDVAFEMEADQISDIVSTPLGLHIIQLIGKREGDVPEAEAKLELSRDLYLEDQSLTMAREAADAALAALTGGTAIDDLDAWMRGQESGEEVIEETAEVAVDGEGEAAAEETVEEEVDPDAPAVTESSSFSRTGRPISGVDSSELVRDVFGRDLENPLPDAPIELGRTFVIYQLTEREEATREEFEDGVSDRIREGLLRAKQREAVELYVRTLISEANGTGRVRVQLHTLDVGRIEGNGTIVSAPQGINCGDDCDANFEFGRMVQLQAQPAPGGTFLGWTGACSGTESTCTVTMTAAQTVSARFRGGSVATSAGDEESDESSDDE